MSTTGNKQMTYEEYLTNVKNAANTAYGNAETAANGTFQSALNTANANYNKAKAEYGANAEALGGMGLRGSGYSNYLNSQAYAQKQSAYNNADFSYQAALADAEARKAATILEADGLMAQYLQQQEANRLNAFNTLMGNIGAYNSIGDIKALADANGITDTDMLNKLAASRSGYIRNNLTGSQYTKKQLDDLYNNGNGELTKTDYEALLNGIYNVSADDISAGTFIDNDNDGEYLNYANAKEMLDYFKNAFGETSNQAKKAQDEFDKLYGVKTAGVTYLKGEGNNPGGSGNNFKVKVEDGEGKEYKVEYSGNKGDASVKQAAETYIDGTVFKYRGVLYIKRGTEVYEIKARPIKPGEYNDLLKLFNSADQTQTEGE